MKQSGIMVCFLLLGLLGAKVISTHFWTGKRGRTVQVKSGSNSVSQKAHIENYSGVDTEGVVSESSLNAEQVSEFTLKYSGASTSERRILNETAIQILQSYRKQWQGNPYRQTLFEASILDLAESARPEFSDTLFDALFSNIQESASLRLKYLTQQGALESDISQAKALASSKQYADCASLCEKIYECTFTPRSDVLIAWGVSLDAIGSYDTSLRKFMEVLEQAEDPESASTASLLAGLVMLKNRNYADARRMLEAVVEDYPSTQYLPRIRELLLRLEEVLSQMECANTTSRSLYGLSKNSLWHIPCAGVVQNA